MTKDTFDKLCRVASKQTWLDKKGKRISDCNAGFPTILEFNFMGRDLIAKGIEIVAVDNHPIFPNADNSITLQLTIREINDSDGTLSRPAQFIFDYYGIPYNKSAYAPLKYKMEFNIYETE